MHSPAIALPATPLKSQDPPLAANTANSVDDAFLTKSSRILLTSFQVFTFSYLVSAASITRGAVAISPSSFLAITVKTPDSSFIRHRFSPKARVTVNA